MTIPSVNINKIATLRTARGGNMPDVEKAARDIEGFGAEGITVHPRPDGRHIKYEDVRLLKKLIRTEFNIEGNPEPSFRDLVMEVIPEQVTLVPDGHDAITSNCGWDTIKHEAFVTEMCNLFHSKGIRVSIFILVEVLLGKLVVLTGIVNITTKTQFDDHIFLVTRVCIHNAISFKFKTETNRLDVFKFCLHKFKYFYVTNIMIIFQISNFFLVFILMFTMSIIKTTKKSQNYKTC